MHFEEAAIDVVSKWRRLVAASSSVP